MIEFYFCKSYWSSRVLYCIACCLVDVYCFILASGVLPLWCLCVKLGSVFVIIGHNRSHRVPPSIRLPVLLSVGYIYR